MKQWLKDFVHNCVVHPAMPFLPVRVANWLHDKNANWAFGLERYDELALEGKKKPIDKQLALLDAEVKDWRAFFNLTHYQEQKLNETFEEYQLSVVGLQSGLEPVLLLKRTFAPEQIPQVFDLVLSKNEAQTQQSDV